MRKGYLSEYFSGIAAKRLSEVETNPGSSHQHEFNGVRKLFELFGNPTEADGKKRMAATFVYLTDDEDDDPVIDQKGLLTWYDARKKGRDAGKHNRHEYRFYYQDTPVLQCATAGDLLVIAQKTDGSLLVMITEHGSTIEQQIIWLFGLGETGQGAFQIRSELDNENSRINLAARFILEQIGIKVENTADAHLEAMLHRFDGKFPATAAFSAFARETLPHIHPRDDVDGALMAWMEQEETLFRALEKHLLQQKLQAFSHDGADTDAFLALAKSALQRRKARAGAALENHLQHIFDVLNIRHSHGGITEGRLKPDFIFPCIGAYHNAQFPADNLAMLAVKTTCKDRWRQILNEAARIPNKHLFTLEPGISENQTDEMQKEKVQLVLPRELHDSYTSRQQSWLMTLREFTGKITIRQAWRLPCM